MTVAPASKSLKQDQLQPLQERDYWDFYQKKRKISRQYYSCRIKKPRIYGRDLNDFEKETNPSLLSNPSLFLSHSPNSSSRINSEKTPNRNLGVNVTQKETSVIPIKSRVSFHEVQTVMTAIHSLIVWEKGSHHKPKTELTKGKVIILH